MDPHAGEAAWIEQIAWLEGVKSAAAAGQARAAAALDEQRRADDAATGVPEAEPGSRGGRRGRVGATRFPRARRSTPGIRQSLGTRDAGTPWPRWSAARSPSGARR